MCSDDRGLAAWLGLGRVAVARCGDLARPLAVLR